MAVEAANAYADLGLALKAPATKNAELGQAEFLQLMTTQLQNQDPFKPMESGEFLSQIAQFSTVSGIDKLNEAFSGLSSSLAANQSLQAAQLVGHGVLVSSSQAALPAEGSMRAAADLPSSGQLVVSIMDASGQKVGQLDLGTRSAGTQHFSWDGMNAAGERLPAGTYSLRATLVQGSTQTALDTMAVGQVRSVVLGAAGLSLELEGLAPVALADVQQIL